MQHGIVQHDDSGLLQRSGIDGRMQRVVPDLVQRDIAALRRNLDAPVLPQSAQQFRRIIRDPSPRRGGNVNSLWAVTAATLVKDIRLEWRSKDAPPVATT